MPRIGGIEDAIWERLLKLKVLRDTRGQDLLEYALLAGFVAVAAGAAIPDIAGWISDCFGYVNFLLGCAGADNPSSCIQNLPVA